MKKIDNIFPIYRVSNFSFSHVFKKEKIISQILKNKKYHPSQGYSYPIYDDCNDYFKNLYLKYYNYCFKKFKFTVDPARNKTTCWTYVSNKDEFSEYWHNHIRTSTINGVYYFNIPKNNTSIDFELDGKILTYHPKQNELIIFPNYLNHKPNRCYDDGHRISINMEIICKETSQELFNRLSR